MSDTPLPREWRFYVELIGEAARMCRPMCAMQRPRCPQPLESRPIKTPVRVTRVARHGAGDRRPPAEFARFIAADQKRRKPVIARAKIKPD